MDYVPAFLLYKNENLNWTKVSPSTILSPIWIPQASARLIWLESAAHKSFITAQTHNSDCNYNRNVLIDSLDRKQSKLVKLCSL